MRVHDSKEATFILVSFGIGGNPSFFERLSILLGLLALHSKEQNFLECHKSLNFHK